ncbi:hypothetical protein [Sphingopyxis macrogoltabida]|uniref:Permease n=1 Tax=Sphingopyxis macrogoltabida TaxID=33050 RepID=A0A0N9UFC4_SPHMC|nr:hypothetical protein [Sphingopyxis macrogoltabida]ALH82162.1 hypothetical protein AN936_17900 [Sphingopyxis macrogoltabida]
MNFFNLLKSLDELLYEVMSWLIFYPVTLWQGLTRPLKMMDYSDAEQGDAEEKQYTDTLSPPLFLLLTLVISHALELSTVGESAIVADKTGLGGLVNDDTTYILMRVAFFSLFPLVMAARLVRARHVKLDRVPLKAPFYSQCYVAAPFALMVSGASILLQLKPLAAGIAGLALLALALLWFGSLQILWFAQHLRISRWRAALHASRAMVEALVLFVLFSLIVT